jgi:CRISPR-associated endonuclease/helicase Cas3
MMSLPSFAVFFRAVHGQEPFPWQVRAAEQLARRATMAVTVPTGLGKSALVDAAVWAAAQGGWRRIAFVVDRRIVVDAVYERARRIAGVLDELRSDLRRDPAPSELATLASRVGEIQVVRLRGGVFGDDDWVLYPERLTIALTTVDQLGSRLLFRGYGVSPRRWPMHAGFFAADSLVVVDEAHLCGPFLQTLAALRDSGAGLALVPMTATPPAGWSADVLGLDATDLAVPTIQQRLHASKLAALREVGTAELDFVRSAQAEVARLLAEPGVRRVLLVVNRVATARACFERIRGEGIAATLLTGRVRPIERDGELARVLPMIAAGRSRADSDTPLVVVATQTVEVGADLDVDALVTESAPLSALRQRFGRLDRLGQRGLSSAVVIHRSTAADKDDPVYGAALPAAWVWLHERADEGSGVVDFGLNAFGEVLARAPAPIEPQAHAASLLPTHLRLLAQTGDFAPELDVSAWLHGATRRVPDVTLIWRADLDDLAPEAWAQALALLPPLLREGLPVPVAQARRWLMRSRVIDTSSDTSSDGGTEQDDSFIQGEEPERAVLVWRGAGDCQLIAARSVRPGDTVVLPAAAGGCDAWGWAPASTAPVTDLAEACLIERLGAGDAGRVRVVLRLVPALAANFGDAADEILAAVRDLQALHEAAATSDDDLDEDIAAARQQLMDLVDASAHPLAQAMRDARLEPHPGGFVLTGRGVDDSEDTVETGCAVALDIHHADVGRWAAQLAGDDPLAPQIVAAALVHDAGKAEPRMQHLLHGSPLGVALGPVLAKSGLRRRDQRLAALAASGLPRGFRHEFASLVHANVVDALTRHLVATHHGRGRPWLTPFADPDIAGAAFAGLAAHWPALWSQLLDEHGPWALARAEWLLRAADARASIEEAATAQPEPRQDGGPHE